jgi:hypothetical protein
MSIIDEAKKLGTLLNERTIFFDHKSYDDLNDIPHIFMDGKRYDVDSATFHADGTALELDLIDKSNWSVSGIGIGFYEDDGVTTEMIEKECMEMGLDTLFRDIYYETPESYTIGDYETDFLK